MEEIIKRIEGIKMRYPKRIKNYSPVNGSKIEFTQDFLNFKLDESLKEIYKYSDGMSFIDYCLLSIDNRKLSRLIDNNSKESIDKSNGLIFITTSGNARFLLDGSGNIHYINEESSKDEIVARNVREFLSKFIDKLEVLLKIISPTDYLIYFDDDGLPGELLKW